MKSSNAAKSNHTVWVLAGLMLGGLFGKAGTGLAAEYTWAQKADMPTARFEHCASVVDGKIYVIAGAANDMTEAIWPTEVYDPVMDKWTTKADIPAVRVAHSASAVDGKIYVIGGAESPEVLLSTVLEYDPAEDTWTTKTNMSTARWFLSTSVVDGKIYVIGGASSLTNLAGLSIVEEYDPVTDTWTRKANMPFGVWGLRTAVVDGKIYALGGRPAGSARPYVQEYDPATDTWTQKSDMPVATSGMGSVVLGDKIIVIGGWLHSGNQPYTTVQMYDTETDIWTIEGDAPFLRSAVSTSVVNHRIYVVGGTDRPHPCPATSTVYELTVSGSPPDFNGDGVVNINDLVRLIESWGQNDPLADIAPALGDDVVDVLDLEFLMGYWGQKIEDPTLVAHWVLDEAEGITAHDSAGDHDGTVMGDAAWRPGAGMVDGALEFDGLDDFVGTDLILDPEAGPFSVLAWIKNDASGQVIVSQADARVGRQDRPGCSWLAIDPVWGTLTTDLAIPEPIPPGPGPTVTDGQWHRVGLVWDESSETSFLYVDEVEVAVSVQPILPTAYGGLRIGAGRSLDPATYFTGLIDDVRIYNRAVRP